jgi:hypothetical protein
MEGFRTRQPREYSIKKILGCTILILTLLWEFQYWKKLEKPTTAYYLVFAYLNPVYILKNIILT